MKFRNPGTGEVFEDLQTAVIAFCHAQEHCVDCPLNRKWCSVAAVREKPVNVAKLMGYEVIENPKWVEINAIKEEPMEQKADKPRICKVLGVKVGEWFSVIGVDEKYCIDAAGLAANKDGHIAPGSILCILINNPEKIIRCPRLTLAELAICKAVEAKYITRDRVDGSSEHTIGAQLWSDKPERRENEFGYSFLGEDLFVALVRPELFPSVKPGDCICVEEADHETD